MRAIMTAFHADLMPLKLWRMAGRDDVWDSEADMDTSKRFQPGFVPDEQVRKSVGVSVYLWPNFQGPVH